jgi:hypothetical protein
MAGFSRIGWAKRSAPTNSIAVDGWWARRKSAFAHPTNLMPDCIGFLLAIFSFGGRIIRGCRIVVLKVVGALISVFLGVASLPAAAQDGVSFSWKKDQAGNDVALSRNDSSFNYFDVGDLSYSSLYLVQQDLGRIAAATGLTVDRNPRKSSSIGIVHDTKVFSRLKNDKHSFSTLGIPDSIIALLERGVKDDTKCIAVSVSDGQSNILFTVVLLSEKFDTCLVHGILESFGILASDIGVETLVSACVLYEGRRLGLRDRQNLLQQTPKLRELCLAKAGERK